MVYEFATKNVDFIQHFVKWNRYLFFKIMQVFGTLNATSITKSFVQSTFFEVDSYTAQYYKADRCAF